MKDDSGKRLPRKKQQLSHPVTTFIGRKLPTVLLGTDLSRSDKVLARLYYRSAFVVMSWLNRQMFAIGDLTPPPPPFFPFSSKSSFLGLYSLNIDLKTMLWHRTFSVVSSSNNLRSIFFSSSSNQTRADYSSTPLFNIFCIPVFFSMRSLWSASHGSE